MARFDYQHLDGLTLEAEKAAIRIDYSEPDQGGTRLLHHFRIFMDGHVERENGYAGDTKLQTKEIERNAVPARVIADALSWIREQTMIAAGRPQVISTLNRIETVLKQ
ncbi:MAG: hypothetical protein WCG22_03980 [Lentisphaerota bacterium]